MTEIGSIRECFGFGFWKFFVLCGVKKMETFKTQTVRFFCEPTKTKPNHRDQLSIFWDFSGGRHATCMSYINNNVPLIPLSINIHHVFNKSISKSSDFCLILFVVEPFFFLVCRHLSIRSSTPCQCTSC
jgi:hypothetical protein